MEEITKIESIDQYDQLFGLETLHPLVNVIDFSKATKTVEYYRMNIGFYSLFLKEAKCGDLRYGRKYYDYQEGTVVCMAPGQVVGIDNRKQTPPRTKSIGLLFHPDLIRGTSLGQNIKHYSFFSYEVNEALHLSEQEKEIVTDCIHKIQIELEHAIDKHSKQLIVRNIASTNGNSSHATKPIKTSSLSLNSYWTSIFKIKLHLPKGFLLSNTLRIKSAFPPIISVT